MVLNSSLRTIFEHLTVLMSQQVLAVSKQGTYQFDTCASHTRQKPIYFGIILTNLVFEIRPNYLLFTRNPPPPPAYTNSSRIEVCRQNVLHGNDLCEVNLKAEGRFLCVVNRLISLILVSIETLLQKKAGRIVIIDKNSRI